MSNAGAGAESSDWETVFRGTGRDRAIGQAPAFTPFPELKQPEGYRADPALTAAVNVAVLLGQPLLITGEPGTGKTLLASRIAWEFGLNAPLVFVARTTSTASDLFYSYDALRRFLDAQVKDDRAEDPGNYVTYQALGLAILLALSPQMGDPYLPAEYRGLGGIRPVVLIDEIDKAPRDLPNDILNEVDSMDFAVKETGRRFPDFEGEKRRLAGLPGISETAAEEMVRSCRETFERNRPIIVLTSNDEQTLPAAFLRRCVYFHIDFPDPGTPEGFATLRTIVVSRLGSRLGANGGGALLEEDNLRTLLALFDQCRRQLKDKKPATAELIAWVWMLANKRLTPDRLRRPDTQTIEDLLTTSSVLVKGVDDREIVKGILEGWAREKSVPTVSA